MSEVDQRWDDPSNYGPGESHHGDGRYPPDWDTRRRTVYRRDEYRCAVCGAGGGPNGDAKLHAHHRTPLSEGGTNELSNLVTLCEECHERQHDHDFQTESEGSILGRAVWRVLRFVVDAYGGSILRLAAWAVGVVVALFAGLYALDPYGWALNQLLTNPLTPTGGTAVCVLGLYVVAALVFPRIVGTVFLTSAGMVTLGAFFVPDYSRLEYAITIGVMLLPGILIWSVVLYTGYSPRPDRRVWNTLGRL